VNHSLIDDFFKAAAQWSDEFDDRDGKGVAFFVMTATGGEHFVPRLGKRDLTGLTEEQIGKLRVGQVYGYHTLEQSHQWIIRLVDDQGFFEPFLIAAMVRWIEDWLERGIEGYGKGIGRRRQAAALARKKLEATPDDAKLLATVQYMERLATPSLDEMREKRSRLDRWRELMASVISEQNISAWYNGLATSVRESPEGHGGQP
jgi:hypothetical protein